MKHTLYQCFLTLPSVLLGNVCDAVSDFCPCTTPASSLVRHTFAISAQLFPASLMFFNLCSSAGVQGVLVRLFFVGGPVGESVMLGSSMPAEEDAAAGAGPDIARGTVPRPDARLLFRAPVGDVDSAFTELSPVVG